MIQSNVDWFARVLSIIAILISLTFLFIHIWQARKQRPILKIEESSISISDEFNEESRKINSALIRGDYKPLLPELVIPMEVHIYLKYVGLATLGISDFEIDLDFIPNSFIKALMLFFQERLKKRGRCLGSYQYFGKEPPFLYFQPEQSPLTFPFMLESGQIIECRGVLPFDLRMPDNVLQAFKLRKSKLKTPLDYTDFIVDVRGYKLEKTRFSLTVFSGKKVVCNGFFRYNKYFPGYWYCPD